MHNNNENCHGDVISIINHGEWSDVHQLRYRQRGAQAQAPQALFVAKSVGQAAPSPPTSLISSNCKW